MFLFKIMKLMNSRRSTGETIENNNYLSFKTMYNYICSDIS